MEVAFRVDASRQIGTGHVMRCLTLANALAAHGVHCQFICGSHEGNLIEFVRSRGHLAHALPTACEMRAATSASSLGASTPDLNHSYWASFEEERDAQACAQLLAAWHPDWLIVDHYALDARWERVLRPHCRRLMVIDDLADRPHVCDLLLDQTFGRDAADYLPLVPDGCRLLCGSRYAMLRPEFAAIRSYSLQRRCPATLRELLITMGGVDKDNVAGQVLQALRACALPLDCRITVVMGTLAPWLDEIRTQAPSMPCPTRVLVGISDMAALMADSDLAIGAAGSTSWELCCLGVPTLLVCTAANQRKVISALASVRAVVRLDQAELRQPDGITFRSQYAALTENLEGYTAVAARITDGRGVFRVCTELT
jgi:UDP-2,4-diacetamido-2,4,6-trideoxy-beta-L-altropyranose hydrolase